MSDRCYYGYDTIDISPFLYGVNKNIYAGRTCKLVVKFDKMVRLKNIYVPISLSPCPLGVSIASMAANTVTNELFHLSKQECCLCQEPHP